MWRVAAVSLLAFVAHAPAEAAKPPTVPSWACSIVDAPKQKPPAIMHLVAPSGSLPVDDAFAEGELKDAKNAADDAFKLDARAHAENSTDAKDAAQDESDAKHLIADTVREKAQAEQFMKIVKKEMAQKVLAVDHASLSKLIEEKKELLVLFYAPWCGHCKTFVLADAQGNPENAPLELLNKEFEAASSAPKIVKFDIDAGGSIPEEFQVQYIPTMYSVTSKGEYKKYEGDPHDFAAVKAFAGVKTSFAQLRAKTHTSLSV